MSPTPLKSLAVEIHLGSVTIQDDSRIVTHERNERLPRPIAEDPKDGKGFGNRHPQPGFRLFFLRRRFINEQLRLLLEFTAKLFIRNSDRFADKILNLYRPGGTAGNIQQVTEEHRRSTFALLEVPHQQAGKGGQAWTALPGGDSRRQFGLGRDATTWAMATEELIFIDDRLNR